MKVEKVRHNHFGFVSSMRTAAWALAAIVAIAAALRFFMASSYSFWFDEILTGIDVQYNYRNFFIDRAKVVEFPLWSWDHPPLYFVMSKYITDWFGPSEITFRATAIIAGILTIPALYLLGKELFGHRAGLLAALLLTIMAFHVRYSQEARPYSLMLFSSVMAYWFLARAMRSSTPWNWIGWTIANLIAIYSHYLAFASLACQVVIAEVARSNRKQLAYLVVACGFIIAAYLPWKDNLLQFIAEPLGGGPSTRTRLAEIVYRLFVSQFGFGYEWLLHIGILLIVVSLFLEKDRAKQSAIIFALGSGFAYLAIFFVDPTSRLMGTRYLLPLLIIWVLLLANAIVKIVLWGDTKINRANWRTNTLFARSNLGILAALLPQLFVVVYIGFSIRDLAVYYQTPREQFKESAEYIKDNMLPGDPVLINRHHYGYNGVLDYYPKQLGYSANVFAGDFDVDQVAAMCVDKQRVWYWTRILKDLSGEPVVEWFNTNGDCSPSEKFNGFLLCSCGESREDILAAAGSEENYPLLVRANLNRSLGKWDEATTLYLEAIQTDADPTIAIQGLRILGQISGNQKLEIDALLQQWIQNPTDESLGRALKQAMGDYFSRNPDLAAELAASAPNLVSHGDFENGNVFFVPGGIDVTPDFSFSLDNSVAHTGTTSLKMEGLTPGFHGGWAAQIPVEGNVPYLFAGYVKTQNIENLKGRLMYWENNGSTHLGWVNFGEPIDEWTFFWTVALIPADQTLINLRPALFEGIGTIWMDELVLINLAENIEKIEASEE